MSDTEITSIRAREILDSRGNPTVEADVVGYDHARIVRTDESWSVEPIGGAGDTFVNDDLVTAPRTLRSGDVIRVGPARMRFESAG